ncbi:MAG TPA: dihydroneopterin aldolase [Bacteroidetes bacterium]|nr:dihydroneopterin aldolase [Bacteroidota bacterium]
MEENLDVIRLNNMVFYAYHGVEKSEKQLGQRFEVDLELYLALTKAGQSDQLSDTVDYTQVYQAVEEIMLEGDFNLLEALAEEIVQIIIDRFPVAGTTVRVRKPHVSLRGIADGVEVEISRP